MNNAIPTPENDPNYDPDYVLDEVLVTSNFNLWLLLGAGAVIVWGMLSD